MLEKPHVIIIMADQLRYDALGPHTPNINRIIQDGYSFNRAYCASPLCVPARGSFFTGLYPNETGCIINPWEPLDREHGIVRKGVATLYERLEKDWDSWHTGKQHLYTEERLESREQNRTHWNSLEVNYKPFLERNGKRVPGGHSFTGLVPEMAHGTTTRVKRYSIPQTGCYEDGFDYFYDGFITNTSLDAIRQRDRNKPFLLNAMYLAPHPPFDVPEPWYSSIMDVQLPDNVGVWGRNQSPLQLYNLTGAIGTRYDREDWEQVWKVYLGLVKLLDYGIGLLIRELEAQEIYDDSLIVFTSDHGEMLGSHCLWQKMCMYEESIRTPLIIKFPKSLGHIKGASDEYVSSIDIFPTLCDYLGIPIPKNISGRSLKSVIEDQAKGREQVFVQFDGNGGRGNFQRCILEDGWKLIVDIFKDEIYLELYNLKTDSQEMNNLVFEKSSHELTQALIGKLRTHMESTNDLLTLPVDLYDRFLEQYLPFKK
ncbi:sulfatase-like hydrolase/transferase [Paenibacillus sp. PL2-23]|uniref:sulfatase family protein n=1 Tax=Paenibacillus sp. PL2-23 TaxID=2100729 RepID=UPI0030FA0A5E